MEAAIILLGTAMYGRAALKRAEGSKGRSAAIVSTVVLAVLLAFALMTDVTGLF